MWVRLCEIYGATLVQSYGESPPRTWVDLVESLSDEQVMRALKDCAQDQSRFPPSTGQFLAWAKPVRAPYHDAPVPALDKPRDRDLAKRTIAALKRMVRR